MYYESSCSTFILFDLSIKIPTTILYMGHNNLSLYEVHTDLSLSLGKRCLILALGYCQVININFKVIQKVQNANHKFHILFRVMKKTNSCSVMLQITKYIFRGTKCFINFINIFCFWAFRKRLISYAYVHYVNINIKVNCKMNACIFTHFTVKSIKLLYAFEKAKEHF